MTQDKLDKKTTIIVTFDIFHLLTPWHDHSKHYWIQKS